MNASISLGKVKNETISLDMAIGSTRKLNKNTIEKIKEVTNKKHTDETGIRKAPKKIKQRKPRSQGSRSIKGGTKLTRNDPENVCDIKEQNILPFRTRQQQQQELHHAIQASKEEIEEVYVATVAELHALQPTLANINQIVYDQWNNLPKEIEIDLNIPVFFE